MVYRSGDGLDEVDIKTVTMTTSDLYKAAILQFDSALAIIGTADASVRNIALIGKARVLVDQATPATLQSSLAAAAAVVTEVLRVSSSMRSIRRRLKEWKTASMIGDSTHPTGACRTRKASMASTLFRRETSA